MVQERGKDEIIILNDPCRHNDYMVQRVKQCCVKTLDLISIMTIHIGKQ